MVGSSNRGVREGKAKRAASALSFQVFFLSVFSVWRVENFPKCGMQTVGETNTFELGG